MNRTEPAAAIAAVMDAYTEGTRARDAAAIRALFHDDAVMSGYLGPQLLVGSIDPFLAHLEANPVDDGETLYASRIVSIAVEGATATARVVEDNLFGISFVNDFHLVRGESGWTITSKLFHHDAPGG